MDRRTADNVKNIRQGPSWRDLKRIVKVIHDTQSEAEADDLIAEIIDGLKMDLESTYVAAE